MNESEELKFDVGYFQGNKRIWIRTFEDLAELTRLLKGRGATVWCDGVNPSIRSKRHAPADESSDSKEDIRSTSNKPSRKKKRSSFDERLEQVDSIIDDLRELNGAKYPSIQYRVWAH